MINDIAHAWAWLTQHASLAWDALKPLPAILKAWLGVSLPKFVENFPENALNALLFGFVIGGSFNWFRNRDFRARRTEIANALTSLDSQLLQAAAAYLTVLGIRDIETYKETIRPILQAVESGVTDFQLSYGAYFSPRQWTAFRTFQAAADKIVKAMIWTKLGDKAWATLDLNEEFEESLAQLGKGSLKYGEFGQLNAAANDFLKAIGIGMVSRRNLVPTKNAQEAYRAWSHLKDSNQPPALAIAA